MATSAGVAQSMASHVHALLASCGIEAGNAMPVALMATLGLLLLGLIGLLPPRRGALVACALLTVKLGTGLLLLVLAARHVHYALWIPWLPEATAPYRFGPGGVLAASVPLLGVFACSVAGEHAAAGHAAADRAGRVAVRPGRVSGLGQYAAVVGGIAAAPATAVDDAAAATGGGERVGGTPAGAAAGGCAVGNAVVDGGPRCIAWACCAADAGRGGAGRGAAGAGDADGHIAGAAWAGNPAGDGGAVPGCPARAGSATTRPAGAGPPGRRAVPVGRRGTDACVARLTTRQASHAWRRRPASRTKKSRPRGWLLRCRQGGDSVRGRCRVACVLGQQAVDVLQLGHIHCAENRMR
ncbi:hypothetical protein G6F31_014737 [Rhizopus arrhizus]|nr:hypothetical protein G6F31_014737 [Rhizopus arrhizus]